MLVRVCVLGKTLMRGGWWPQGVAGQADKTKDKVREVAGKAAKKLRKKKDKPCRMHIKVCGTCLACMRQRCMHDRQKGHEQQISDNLSFQRMAM